MIYRSSPEPEQTASTPMVKLPCEMNQECEPNQVLGKRVRGTPEAFCTGVWKGDLSEFLRNIRKRDDFSDVVFVVEGKKFLAHRNILSACSPALQALFMNGMKETGEREVVLHEVKANVWRLVLDFLYGEEISLENEQHCLEVLECAQRFLLDDLQSTIANALGSKITEANVWDLTNAAYQLSNSELKSKVLLFLGKNFSHIAFNEHCTSLEVFEDVIQQPNLGYRGECLIAQNVLEWIVANESCTAAEQARLLSHLKIEKMSEDDLKLIARSCNDHTKKPAIRAFQISCMDRIVNGEFDFASCTPISPDDRVEYNRNWSVFSFKQRLQLALGLPPRTDSFREPALRCRYFVTLNPVHDEVTTVKLTLGCRSERWPKKYRCQLFVMDSLEKKVLFTTINHEANVERSTWLELVDDFDCVVIGATVYFSPEM